MKLEVRVASVTDVGRVRESNQDAVLAIRVPGRNRWVFAVADGVGGLADGARASRSMVDSLTSATRDGASLPETITRAVAGANAELYAQGLSSGRQTGTTVVVVCIDGDLFTVQHAGDSRAYLFRSGHLEQLTADHSWVAEQVHNGSLAPEAAAASPYRNIITRCVGVEPSVVLELRDPAPLLAGDTLLLCSDGLHGLVPAEEIVLALSSPLDEWTIAHDLVARANAHGGTDNISVIVARVDGGDAARRDTFRGDQTVRL